MDVRLHTTPHGFRVAGVAPPAGDLGATVIESGAEPPSPLRGQRRPDETCRPRLGPKPHPARISALARPRGRRRPPGPSPCRPAHRPALCPGRRFPSLSGRFAEITAPDDSEFRFPIAAIAAVRSRGSDEPVIEAVPSQSIGDFSARAKYTISRSPRISTSVKTPLPRQTKRTSPSSARPTFGKGIRRGTKFTKRTASSTAATDG